MKQPLHPALVHFPVACWTLATAADAVGLWGTPWPLWQLAFVLLAIGCAIGLLTAAAGFYELARLPDEHPALADASRHMMLALGAWVAFATSLFLRMDGTVPTPPGVAALTAGAIGFLLLVGAGHMGGRLVYVHGVGRRS
ncbi:MAG: DUF2231 domain-containing protein [Xanthomonadaceae bacterium]|nr:DUF2231 domain-containing protein [Xanthomonadaceae bacterium]